MSSVTAFSCGPGYFQNDPRVGADRGLDGTKCVFKNILIRVDEA